MQFNSLVERMITWKHIRNFGENTEGLPCIDTQRRAALELLVIKTPHGLSCTTGCHTSSCSPCDTVWGQSQGRISQHGLHLCDRQSSAPRSPCRAAQSPCSAPAASPSASAILCISHLQYTRDGQGTCAMTTDKTQQQTSEKPSSPHSTPSSFSQQQNRPQSALGCCFHQKKGMVQRYFIKGRATDLSPGLYSNHQRAQLKNWIAFGMKYLLLLKTAEQVSAPAFHQQARVIISSFNCILKILWLKPIYSPKKYAQEQSIVINEEFLRGATNLSPNSFFPSF